MQDIELAKKVIKKFSFLPFISSKKIILPGFDADLRFVDKSDYETLMLAKEFYDGYILIANGEYNSLEFSKQTAQILLQNETVQDTEDNKNTDIYISSIQEELQKYIMKGTNKHMVLVKINYATTLPEFMINPHEIDKYEYMSFANITPIRICEVNGDEVNPVSYLSLSHFAIKVKVKEFREVPKKEILTNYLNMIMGAIHTINSIRPGTIDVNAIEEKFLYVDQYNSSNIVFYVLQQFAPRRERLNKYFQCDDCNALFTALLEDLNALISNMQFVCDFNEQVIKKIQANNPEDFIAEYLQYVKRLQKNIKSVKKMKKIPSENEDFDPVMLKMLRDVLDEVGDSDNIESIKNNRRNQKLNSNSNVVEELTDEENLSVNVVYKKYEGNVPVEAIAPLKKFTDEIMPREALKVIDDDLFKLSKQHDYSPDFSLYLNHLHTIYSLPWRKYANVDKDYLDIKAVKKVLDGDNYGLDQVKDRILEHIAVMVQNKYNSTGAVICLVGPPGVGKTSIAKSIAKAMGREFTSIALGGVEDPSDLRGHRKTYIGAMPGRIISALMKCKTSNPLFLLDEIDKLSTSPMRGLPWAVLLEILDPTQNTQFQDNFLEIPYDISKVFFITTANDKSEIPRALYDRLEIIEIEGYTYLEKTHIANEFLIPKQNVLAGLKEDSIKYTEEALSAVINEYTFESGVRKLEQKIAEVARKLIKKHYEDNVNDDTKVKEFEDITLTKGDIFNLLGSHRVEIVRLMTEDRVGMVNGLAWTAYGGTVLPIEAIILKTQNKNEVILTGKLGDVMQESAKLAYSQVTKCIQDRGIDISDNLKAGIHIHVPEGAVPKDGPSAGIALATVIFSALTNKKVRSDVAMTGELTLTGKVLPIGGLKEKILAAIRDKLSLCLLPIGNKKDYDELKDEVKNSIRVEFVSNIDEVLKLAIVEDDNK